MTSSDKSLFLSLGLKEKVVDSFLKNDTNTKNLKKCINEAGVTNGCETSIGKLIYEVATNKNMNNDNAIKNRPTLLKYIVNKNITSTLQIHAGINYCANTEQFNIKNFENSCGVGVIVTSEQIEEVVDSTIKKFSDQLKTKGKRVMGPILGDIKKQLPWADGALLHKIFQPKFNDALIASGYDPKSKSSKSSPKKKKKVEKKEDDEEEVITMEKWLKGRDLPVAHNTKEQLKARVKAIGEKDTFISRFPPEPNGFLHIGHCKAMTFNFTLAEKHGGYCVLRFDDTNPEKEEQLYIDNIIENVKWMGFTPYKITYSSDYFQELYDLAIKMIKNGNAYICRQKKDDIEKERQSIRLWHKEKSLIEKGELKPSQLTNKIPLLSPWRNTSIEDNLSEFKLMKCGYYDEGERALRMKGDWKHPNPNMWDHVAYRIKYVSHPHVGDKWCVYPTYDYTHCIIDSLEWITASCCTLEFENRRESYFWLLDILNLYKPVVWEYSRLNIEYNVMSKRKLQKLVFGGYVRGWDDPRMYTINGLRRRGYTAEILRSFCDDVGVSRKTNFIRPAKLESSARKILDDTCSRAMAIINPLKIVIENYDENKTESIECPNFPQDKTRGTHNVTFSNVVYISSDDFVNDKNASKKFYGLAPGRTVRLKYAYNITCNDVIKDKNGNILELHCNYDPSSRHDVKKVKRGHLTWVSDKTGVPCEIRLYDYLFTVDKPDDDWLKQLNPDSEVICDGFVNYHVTESNEERFQFERLGYFVKDKDYTNEKPVFNRTVTLNESSSFKKITAKRGKK